MSHRMESRDQIEEIAATWIVKRDTGPWTDATRMAFDEWLAQSASHRAAYYRLNAAWEEAGRLRVFGTTTYSPRPSTPADELERGWTPNNPARPSTLEHENCVCQIPDQSFDIA